MCFLWGFQDSAVNTQIQETLGFEFDNASSEPFSIYNIFQCLACFIFQLIEAQVNDNTGYFYYTIVVAVICLVANGLPYFFPFREHLANQNDIIGSILGSHKPHNSPGKDSNRKSNRVSKENHYLPNEHLEEASEKLLAHQDSVRLSANIVGDMGLNRTDMLANSGVVNTLTTS